MLSRLNVLSISYLAPTIHWTPTTHFKLEQIIPNDEFYRSLLREAPGDSNSKKGLEGHKANKFRRRRAGFKESLQVFGIEEKFGPITIDIVLLN